MGNYLSSVVSMAKVCWGILASALLGIRDEAPRYIDRNVDSADDLADEGLSWKMPCRVSSKNDSIADDVQITKRKVDSTGALADEGLRRRKLCRVSSGKNPLPDDEKSIDRNVDSADDLADEGMSWKMPYRVSSNDDSVSDDVQISKRKVDSADNIADEGVSLKMLCRVFSEKDPLPTDDKINVVSSNDGLSLKAPHRVLLEDVPRARGKNVDSTDDGVPRLYIPDIPLSPLSQPETSVPLKEKGFSEEPIPRPPRPPRPATPPRDVVELDA